MRHTRQSQFRPGLVLPRSPSMWGSCQTILPNLESAYRMALGKRDLRTYAYGRGQSDVDCMASAIKIREAGPTHLIFIDHERHPRDLLLALDLVYQNKSWPKLVFHVYGDFTLYTSQWKECGKILAGRKVLFVCASPRQRNFVANMIRDGAHHTAVCPFPVAENEYFFSSGVRESARVELQIDPEEFAIVYTGRLSAQKNILRMVWDVSHKCDEVGIPFRIILAGTFDDMGSPFFGLEQPRNSYYHGFNKMLSTMPTKLRRRVQHIGSLDKSDLRRLYHAGDLFVSFSTHHDEDFGMSPVEALCCGTPALISDWGGFAAFAVEESSVRLLPVTLSSHGPKINTLRLGQELSRFHKLKADRDDQLRAQQSKLFHDRFGVSSICKDVNTLYENGSRVPFVGMSTRLHRHAQLNDEMKLRGYMFKPGKRIDSNYREFYRHYCAKG